MLAAGKRCECTTPLMLPMSFEDFRGHVAIGALLRLRRIVERTRALSGNSAGLPVVVLIEATEPAVMIHRNIEMNLVARRAELRRLVAHERFQEHATVRLGIQLDQEIMQARVRSDSSSRPVRAAWDIRDKNRPGPSCSSRWRWSGTSCSPSQPALRGDAQSA